MKHFNSILILISILSTSNIALSQDIPVIAAYINPTYDFSIEMLDAWSHKDSLFALLNEDRSKYDDFSPQEKTVLEVSDMPKESIWDVLNWYAWTEEIICTPTKEYLSLHDNDSLDSGVRSLIDQKYNTAWIVEPDVETEMFFEIEMTSLFLEVNGISIDNGYVKSKKDWKDNGRVKTLKIYVDNEPLAILKFEDVYAPQFFFIPSIRYTDEETFMLSNLQENNIALTKSISRIIRFEVIDIFHGDKNKSIVITEILFNGNEE